MIVLPLNWAYLKSPPGIIQLAEIVLCILSLICCGSLSCGLWEAPGHGFAIFVLVLGLIGSNVLLVLYSLGVPEKVPRIPWTIVGFGFSAVMTFFCFVSFCIACTGASQGRSILCNASTAYGAAAFFLFFTTAAYGADTFLYFKLWRSGGNRGGSGAEAGATGMPGGMAPGYPAMQQAPTIPDSTVTAQY